MKPPVTLLNLLSICILITTIGASSVVPSSVQLSNTTFQEKHGGGCVALGDCNKTQSVGSALSSDYLEAFYGVIIITFVTLT
jgi:hypothetical protein